MKILKGVLYFALIIFAAGLLAAVFAPSSKKVTRSLSIEADPNTVFAQIVDFRNWSRWDAWYAKDTTQHREFIGEVGEKNQSYTWDSENDDVKSGRMKMLNIENPKRIDYKFYFLNGNAEDSANGFFTLQDLEGQTEVTWTMVSKMSYPMKFFNYFIEGMVAPDFEEGLARLKGFVEKNPFAVVSSATMADVQIVSEYGINYAIVKTENLPMTESEAFFRDGYQKIFRYMNSNGLLSKGPLRGLIYNWDEANQQTTIAAAVPISDVLEVESEGILLGSDSAELSPDQISALSLGGYADSYKVHTALYEYLEKNEKEMKSPVVEEYVVGPFQTQDSTTFITKIIYHF